METRLVKIDEVCEITSSKRIFAKEYIESGIPFYRGKEVTEKYKGNLNVTTELFISEQKYEEIKAKHGVPVAGDMLLTSVGTLGSTYIVRPTDKFYFKDGNLTWFRNFNGLNSKYLKYWLESPVGKGELKKSIIGSSQSAYTIANLKQMQISLPSEEEQQQVVDVLEAYDNLIENNNRRIAILEEMAQSLYREWFVKFRFPGHEKAKFIDSPLGKIPEGWEVKAFTDIADVLSGGTPKTKVDEYWNGDIPFFAPKDAPPSFYCTDTEKSITELGLSKCNSKLYQAGTVFITARGTVGKVVMPARDMAMNQSCYALKGIGGIGQRFLFLMTKNQVDYLKKNTGGATFDTIVVDTFRQMKVVFPTHNVFTEFECVMEPLFDQILNLIKKNNNLKTQRDMLLPKLISGTISIGTAVESAA